jgi:hypothetical protein
MNKMYSIPALKTKHSSIVDTLNEFAKTHVYTQFEIAKLKKEAEDIKNSVDVASGFALLGMIACLERDEKKVRSFFQRALDQSGKAIPHIINFGVSLRGLGFYEDAYRLAVEAYERDQINIICLNLLIELACILNKKDVFKEALSMWHKLKKEKHLLEIAPSFRQADPKTCSDFLSKYKSGNKLPEGHLSPEAILTKCSLEIVHIFGIPVNVVAEIMLDPEFQPNLVAWIQWFGDFDEGMKLYDQFEGWYLDHDYDLRTDIVNFNIEFVEEAHIKQVRLPIIMPIKIRSLPSRKYSLKVPIDIILEKHADEVLALFPELTLCGEGDNESEAINDLKADILDLLDDLEDTPEDTLGVNPKLWKQSLESMVTKCQ